MAPEVHFSKLCHHCQLISSQLQEIKDRQVATDDEYYANSHPDERDSKIALRPGRKRRAFPHYLIESELQASVDAGCALCARLIEGDKYGEEKIMRDKPLAAMTCFMAFSPTKHQADEWQLHLRLGWDPGNVRIVYIKPIPSPQEVVYLNPSTNTRDGLQQAKAWFEECKTHHSCLPSSEATESQLPTRLLDISTSKVYLCLSSNLHPQTPYATLSHCWGTSKYLTLKTANITQFTSLIPASALSRTFLDSIFIARYLGLQYIWIDSLCIIQDAAKDWAHESALMSRVYGLSTINIAASGASDGSKGCFFPRPITWNCIIPSESLSPLVAYSQPALKGRFTMMPLSTRGWVVQERVLPRRTIFFTQKEVFWECDALGACESFPSQFPPELYDTDVVIGIKKRPMKMENWEEFVRLYTKANLTMSKDKLVAIAGIAQAVHEESNDGYVAGLWRTGLEYQLLWKNLHGKGFRPDEYRAPSWAWPAIDAVIALQRSNALPDISTIHAINLEHSPPGNPFGIILSGTLRISTRQLLRGTLRRNPPCVKLDGYAVEQTNVDLDAANDGRREYDGLFCGVWILPIGFSKPWRKDCLLLKAVGEELVPIPEPSKKKSGLRSLFTRKTKGKEKEKEKDGQGTAQTPRQYQRLGIVEISIEWWLHERKAMETGDGITYAALDKDYSEILVDGDGRRTCLVDLI